MGKKKPQINICFAYSKFKISQKLVEKIFSHILKEEKISPDCIIDIAFVNNAEIKKLNKKYRCKNKPTDVLSFSMIDNDFENNRLKGGHPEPLASLGYRASSGPPLLGEIIISVPYAESQAKEKKHPLKNEIIFLLIHGLLHLLGYDDETVKGYDAMMKKQNHYLKQIKSN